MQLATERWTSMVGEEAGCSPWIELDGHALCSEEELLSQLDSLPDNFSQLALTLFSLLFLLIFYLFHSFCLCLCLSIFFPLSLSPSLPPSLSQTRAISLRPYLSIWLSLSRPPNSHSLLSAGDRRLLDLAPETSGALIRWQTNLCLQTPL